MHRRAAAARSRLPRIRRHHPAGPGPDRLGNRSDGPAPGLAGRRRLGKGRIRRIGPQGMEPPRQCHALFDHQGLQRDPAPARSRERTTHPDARRGERPQERSFVGGLLHERHRPRRQRPPNGNGVGRMAFVDHLHIRRQDRSGRTGGRDGRRACRRQDQNEDRRRSPDLRTGLLVLLRHVRPQTRRTAFRRGIQAHRNLQPGVYHHALGIPLRRRLRHHLLARRHGTERRRGGISLRHGNP